MDEIFMKLTTEDEVDNSNNNHNNDDLLINLSKDLKLLNGSKLMFQQFRGTFIKCALHSLRNWKMILMQLLLPSIFTIFDWVNQ